MTTDSLTYSPPSRLLSLGKAISWRISSSSLTFVIVWLLTHSLAWSAQVSVLEVFFKIVLFYCHERVWLWLRSRVQSVRGR